MLSVRLDQETEARLSAICRRLGYSKSEVVKRSLEQWLAAYEPVSDAYALGEDLFDQGGGAAMPRDPLRRAIRGHLDEKYRSG